MTMRIAAIREGLRGPDNRRESEIEMICPLSAPAADIGWKIQQAGSSVRPVLIMQSDFCYLISTNPT
jgi:hypothetical protein